MRPPLFQPEDFLVTVGTGDATRSLDSALELLGGIGIDGDPGDGSGADVGHRPVRGIIASIDALATISPPKLDELRRRSSEVPLLLFPSRSEIGVSPRAAGVLRALGAPELTIADPAPVDTYELSDSQLLWPFCNLRLTEARSRLVATAAPIGRGIEPLISSRGRCVFFRWRRGSRQVFVSLTSPVDPGLGPLLADEFCPARFASLMPLMLFARASLGQAGWRTQRPRATFMVDDPNLRSLRYGCLDYQSLVRAAKERDLHFTIAMIPIDYKKTRQDVASFLREHSRFISLVPHGVEHLKREFGRDVPIEKALATLRAGLTRMRIHHQATGVRFPLAMTFPHGESNTTWLEAMRMAGFQAAFATRAFPFKRKSAIDDPLYEMYPAEMKFRGFPIVNRFRAEAPREQLLFQAWLGKPLVLYTHHGFFGDGMEPVLSITDFLDRQVEPIWQGVESILSGNYQWRRTDQGPEARVFANATTISAGHGARVTGVLKPGAAAAGEELARVDGVEVALANHEPLGVAIDKPGGSRGRMTISFEPRFPPVDVASRTRTPLRAGIRRLATEVRDNSSAGAAIARRRAASAS